MQCFNDAGQEVHDCDGWMRLAPPAAANHIAEGRSAVEMCRAWIEGDAVDRVTAMLSRGTVPDELPIRIAKLVTDSRKPA
jgi:hypothetical protein